MTTKIAFARDAAEGVRRLKQDASRLALDAGIHFMDGTVAYKPDGWGYAQMKLAVDAEPTLTTAANSGIPALLTTFIDPDILTILFAANKAAKILGSEGKGERKKGDWTELVAMFPVIESTGDVSSYGDYSNNGSSGANMTFPQRQSYHYQTFIQYGEREIAMAAKAQVDLASQKKRSAIIALDKFQNQTYFLGVSGLQNYGILNDPNLTAALQPGPKAFGAQAHGPWITNGVVTATPTEVYADIQTLFYALVGQTDGLVELDMESKLVLAMSPSSQVALTAVNSFNVDVFDILEKNFPNMRFETAVQYATAAGNLVQLIAEDVEGQESGYAAFTEKLRAHAIVRHTSSFEQKMSQGTWGAIIRQPFAFVQMLGV